MGRDRVLSGAAFRAAILSLLAVLVVIAAAGVFCYGVVRQALYSGLEAQLAEEVLLFGDIFHEGGLPAVETAVAMLEDPTVRGSRRVVLVDPNGLRLAGTRELAPMVVGVTRTMKVISDTTGDEVAVRGVVLERNHLVVGRSIDSIEATLGRLVLALVIASAVIFAMILGTGWVYSKRSLEKLEQILGALQRVSRGDLSARTGPMRGDGQIEAISQLIDQSLDRLGMLVEGSQNTIRAVAHDLRSPLNRAVIRLEEAADAPPGERQALEEKAIAELHRVGRIFDTVLRISAIEAASGQDSLARVDLAGLVREAVTLFPADFEEKAQTLTLALAEGVGVNGDGQALQQMLVNLLANANKHTPRGSEITVRVSEEGGRPTLAVCDNGAGIAPDERDEVLKPFVRLDRSRTEEGSGLGLALVQAVATRHGATVELGDNAPGLCVAVVFPPPGRKLQESL